MTSNRYSIKCCIAERPVLYDAVLSEYSRYAVYAVLVPLHHRKFVTSQYELISRRRKNIRFASLSCHDDNNVNQTIVKGLCTILIRHGLDRGCFQPLAYYIRQCLPLYIHMILFHLFLATNLHTALLCLAFLVVNLMMSFMPWFSRTALY